jgi:hypothetical protein
MRIVKEKTLVEYCKLSKYTPAKEALKAIVYEVRFSNWDN